MQKIPKNIKVGTKVKLDNEHWYVVTEIVHEKWIKVEGIVGQFQFGHILKYTNKQD